MNAIDLFSLQGKHAVITGGVGLLGQQHAEAIAMAGGISLLIDLPAARPATVAKELSLKLNKSIYGYECDITKIDDLKKLQIQLQTEIGNVDILINNAANNPKMNDSSKADSLRFENFSMELWNEDIAVGLTGAFLCSQVFGQAMANNGYGVIVNIASDLSLIAPDQRIYREEHLLEKQQSVKPVTYSVVKTGLIGLTKYLATYWAEQGVRVNALSPGGMLVDQNPAFVKRLSSLIPMNRMASLGEYQAAIIFLCSEASSYMTGHNLVIDGGRTCW